VTVGSYLATKTNNVFGDVSETASQATNLISEISMASREQADDMSQINAAMNIMN
jgi:methyl-accepting chemotaxis protein